MDSARPFKGQFAVLRLSRFDMTTFWGGYCGYFQDPDGHLWEIVWNPQWSEEGA